MELNLLHLEKLGIGYQLKIILDSYYTELRYESPNHIQCFL